MAYKGSDAEISRAAVDRSFWKGLINGLTHVVIVAWTVPAVQSKVATLLIRCGVPGTLVAIGIAVGEKLAQ